MRKPLHGCIRPGFFEAEGVSADVMAGTLIFIQFVPAGMGLIILGWLLYAMWGDLAAATLGRRLHASRHYLHEAATVVDKAMHSAVHAAEEAGHNAAHTANEVGHAAAHALHEAGHAAAHAAHEVGRASHSMQAGPHKLEHAHLPPTLPPQLPRPSRERVEQLRHK